MMKRIVPIQISVFLTALLVSITLAFCQGKPISPEKAMMMGYVEDFFANNARDITMRKSLEWGDVQTDDTGNRTIRYKYEALIWDKERLIICSDFTFDKEGNYVNMVHVEGFPQPVEKPDITTLEGVKKLVEKFFSQNFRDITARKTVSWGELEKHDDGSVSLVYRYEATIWDKDVILEERKFTFDKNGEYQSCDHTEGFPQPIGKAEKSDPKPNPSDQAIPADSPLSFLTPAWILEQEAQERPMFDNYWNGHSTMSTFRFALRFGEKWLDITPEQKQKFRFLAKPNEVGVQWFRQKQAEQDPELMKAYEEANNAKPKGDPQLRQATEEQKRAYVKAAGKPFELFETDVSRQLEEALTPEQLKKLQSLEFMLLPEMGIACPAMFDCLGLSDEQKAKVDAIRNELSPEFEKLLDLRMEVRRLWFEKMIESVIAKDKETPLDTQNDVMEAMSEAANRIGADKTYSQRQADCEKQQKEFVRRLKNRLTELLTAEQKGKMQTMIDDAPDFIKDMMPL
jgi:Spy/CpxP family protein refolding chaperone